MYGVFVRLVEVEIHLLGLRRSRVAGFGPWVLFREEYILKWWTISLEVVGFYASSRPRDSRREGRGPSRSLQRSP